MVVPRTSRYVIELSAEERDELERRAREVTAPWRDVQRARMILYAAEGMADIEIAARLDCHPDSVSSRRRRFCGERLDGLADRPRAGRARRHATVPVAAGRPALVEFEYRRGGTLAYLAAWDVHHARIFGRCEPKTGIEPFGRLVEQVMSSEPYASAKTVFWIVDNGSSHAGQRSIDRMQDAYPNARLIHLPIH